MCQYGMSLLIETFVFSLKGKGLMDTDNSMVIVVGRRWVEVEVCIRGINGNRKKYRKKLYQKNPPYNILSVSIYKTTRFKS